MKTNFLKLSLITFLFFAIQSCTKDDTSTNEISSSTSTNLSNTWVKLTALSTKGDPKANYIIMMFDQPATPDKALPPIKKQVTTDDKGLAYFDLNGIITDTKPKTYYLEAFISDGKGGYIWKSITNYKVDLTKGTTATSSIIVN